MATARLNPEFHHEPRHVIIYGAGVIGREYASIFRGGCESGSDQHQKRRCRCILDQEMSDSLLPLFLNSGVVILVTMKSMRKIGSRDDGVIMHLKSGKN